MGYNTGKPTGLQTCTKFSTLGLPPISLLHFRIKLLEFSIYSCYQTSLFPFSLEFSPSGFQPSCSTQIALTNVINDLHDAKSNRILSLHLVWPPSFWLSTPKSLESFLTSLYMSHINLSVFISFTVTFTYIWKPTISHYLYFLHSGLTYIIYCLHYCSSLSANGFASHVPPQSTLNTASRVRLWNSKSDHVTPLLRTLQWLLTPLRVKSLTLPVTCLSLPSGRLDMFWPSMVSSDCAPLILLIIHITAATGFPMFLRYALASGPFSTLMFFSLIATWLTPAFLPSGLSSAREAFPGPAI